MFGDFEKLSSQGSSHQSCQVVRRHGKLDVAEQLENGPRNCHIHLSDGTCCLLFTSRRGDLLRKGLLGGVRTTEFKQIGLLLVIIKRLACPASIRIALNAMTSAASFNCPECVNQKGRPVISPLFNRLALQAIAHNASPGSKIVAQSSRGLIPTWGCMLLCYTACN